MLCGAIWRSFVDKFMDYVWVCMEHKMLCGMKNAQWNSLHGVKNTLWSEKHSVEHSAKVAVESHGKEQDEKWQLNKRSSCMDKTIKQVKWCHAQYMPIQQAKPCQHTIVHLFVITRFLCTSLTFGGAELHVALWLTILSVESGKWAELWGLLLRPAMLECTAQSLYCWLQCHCLVQTFRRSLRVKLVTGAIYRILIEVIRIVVGSSSGSGERQLPMLVCSPALVC